MHHQRTSCTRRRTIPASCIEETRISTTTRLPPNPYKPLQPRRLLSESWRTVRPLLQDALKAVPQRQPELAAGCAALGGAARKLDEALAARASAAEAWRQYRHLLVFYAQVRVFMRACVCGGVFGVGCVARLFLAQSFVGVGAAVLLCCCMPLVVSCCGVCCKIWLVSTCVHARCAELRCSCFGSCCWPLPEH